MGSALETLCGQAFGAGQVHMLGIYLQRSWIILTAQVVYVVGWCNEGWSGLSWLAFKDIWGFVKLSFASAVMLCLEIWYIMSIIVLTGHLNNAVTAVGSLSICMNFNGWVGMLFIGINAAISVRVSNELGSGRPRGAKYAVYVIVFQSFLIGLLCMVAVLITKDYFSIIFTSSQDLQMTVSKLAFLLGITMVLNSVHPVISGNSSIAVGAGWQGLVAYINIFCYYVFGLPLGFLLGYKANLGVKGIWEGMIAGTGLQTLLLLFILYKTNWNKEVEQTTERMKKWGGHDQSSNGHGKQVA
ncbi:Protein DETOXIFICATION 34 [Linum perenne]